MEEELQRLKEQREEMEKRATIRKLIEDERNKLNKLKPKTWYAKITDKWSNN